MEGFVNFLIVAAVVLTALVVFLTFAGVLFNCARSRARERAVVRSRAAGSHGNPSFAHDALAVGSASALTTHAAGDASGASGAGEPSGGGYESPSSGGDGGGVDYGGGGDFGGGGGGGSWS